MGAVSLALTGCASSTTQTAATPTVEFTTEGNGTGHVVNVDLTSTDTTVQEIAPGIRFNAWTFNGTAPGPVIRVKQGDTVRFTLHNASQNMAHSIDFHAAQTPGDKNY